jgi:hypothetical protein
MKRNNPIVMNRPALSFFMALASTGFALADTVILKDGTKLEGKITRETADLVTIKGEGISNVKDVLKSNIIRIERSGPDDTHFEGIQNLIPTPDRLSIEEYQERVGKCTAFLNIHTTSKHVATVKLMKIKLEDELKKAARGDLKFKGRWIRSSDRIKDAYEIDAEIELSDMKADLEQNRYTLGLRHFEKIQSDFAASGHYADALDLNLKALAAYKPGVQAQLASVDRKLKERADNVLRVQPGRRAEEQKAIDRKDAAYKKLIVSEKARRTKWLTLNEYHRDPLRQVLSSIEASLRTLGTPPAAETKLAAPLYREAWSAAQDGEIEEGKKLLAELRTLKVPKRYLDPLEVKLQPKEEPVAPTPPTATTPVPPPTAEPEVEKPAPDPKVETTEQEKPKDPSDSSESANEDSKEEAKNGVPTQTILIVLLVVVIGGALVVAFAGKKK